MTKFEKTLMTSNKLGDFILQLRFSSKFHLQMCAGLSQAGKHEESLKKLKVSSLMCEDNLIKTKILFDIINEENKENFSKQECGLKDRNESILI